jgi:hypothetical protein
VFEAVTRSQQTKAAGAAPGAASICRPHLACAQQPPTLWYFCSGPDVTSAVDSAPDSAAAAGAASLERARKPLNTRTHERTPAAA